MSLLPRNRVALLFGPEDRGLTNEELERCQALVRIPTTQFASLNVAQAVLILCYELHKAGGLPLRRRRVPRLASVEELEAMYKHLKETLTQISLIHPSYADHGMRKVRQFLSRVRLRRNEVQMIRGLCRQIHWYAERRLQQLHSGEDDGERQVEPPKKNPKDPRPAP
jgi:tRNA/rRNA methyltransferase